MTRKDWLLIFALVALVAIAVYLNSDWFRDDRIQIVHRAVQQRMVRNAKPPKFGEVRVVPILFSFDRKLALTEVKVVNAAEVQTNKYAHPLWHMVTDSNSVPTMGIVYGAKIPGMRPAIKNATADPCAPGIKYRLMIAAGSKRAEHDFVVQPASR